MSSVDPASPPAPSGPPTPPPPPPPPPAPVAPEPPASMATSAGPPAQVPQARPVSVMRRIPLGVVTALFLGLVFVALPWFLIPIVTNHGIVVASNYLVLAAVGTVFAVFEGARVTLKPTRWYGPLWIVSSAAFLSYLVYLASKAVISLQFISNLYIAVGYSLLLALLAIVPALTLCASIVTTIEDLRHPGERMPFDFPMRRRDRKRLARQAASPPPPT